MRLWSLFLIFAVSAAPAVAQGSRVGDVTMGAADLAAVLAGQTLEFFDGSLARYAEDSSYQYRYRPEDPPFVGTWDTNEESEVCVVFDNGFSRCDRIVRSAERLVLITEDGLRFPVRALRPNS
ncbi:MAG: hypothetical protein AAGG09_18555 [Pseudomonadota bacterium]